MTKDQFFVIKNYINDFLEYEYASEMEDADTISILRTVVNGNIEDIDEYEWTIIRYFLFDTILYDGIDNSIALADSDESKKVLEIAREICD